MHAHYLCISFSQLQSPACPHRKETHTYISTYIHTYIHACMHIAYATPFVSCKDIYIHTCMHAYMHAYIHAYTLHVHLLLLAAESYLPT